MMQAGHPKLLPALGFAAGLAILMLAAYAPVLTHEFVNCDDPTYVTENLRVQGGLSWSNLAWAFTTSEAEFWHPLTWLSHMLDCQCFGLKPWGHHLTNLLLHLANTLLVFFCFERLTGARARSFVVAALFGLHPLHVESAAWVAERKDLLSACFGLLAVWAYGQSLKSKVLSLESKVERMSDALHTSRFTLHAPRFYLLSLLFFALGLMSKPMIVTLPFVLLLLDYWPLNRIAECGVRNAESADALGRSSFSKPHSAFRIPYSALVWEKLPFFALAFCASVLAWWIQQSRHNLGRLDEFPITLRLSNALVAYGRYLRKTIWPGALAVFYPYPQGWPLASVLAAAVLLAAISLLALWLIRRRPYLAVGWFWFLGTLVPVIGLVQVGRHAMADRYTYFPLIGLFLAIVWLVADLLSPSRHRRAILSLATCLALGACLMATHRQLRHWQNSETLARHALLVTADNYVAENNLGAALHHAGKVDEALVHYAAALKMKPDFAPGHNNLALVLAGTGHRDKAIAHWREALRLEPRYASAHYLLADQLDQQGRVDEALAQYQEALRLQPDFPEAANGLGTMLAARGRWNEATACFARAVRLKPDYAEAHNNLGTAYMTCARLPEAATEFENALRLKPDYTDARGNLGKALYYQHRGPEAAPHFAAVLKANPASLEALDLLARILATAPDAQARNGAEAVRLAERAAGLTGHTNALVLDSLAAAYAEAGRFPDAVRTAEDAIQKARASGQPDLSVHSAEHLKLYQAQRPLRE
jgi:protein O-mannosyl-transferase